MMDALKASDALMFGNIRFERWRERFEAQWNAPDMLMIDVAWANMPPEMQNAIRMIAPKELLDVLDGGNNGKTNTAMD